MFNCGLEGPLACDLLAWGLRSVVANVDLAGDGGSDQDRPGALLTGDMS